MIMLLLLLCNLLQFLISLRKNNVVVGFIFAEFGG